MTIEDYDEIWKRAEPDMRRLLEQRTPITITLLPIQAWGVMTNLQIALRQLENSGPLSVSAMVIAMDLERQLCTTPPLLALSATGWQDRPRPVSHTAPCTGPTEIDDNTPPPLDVHTLYHATFRGPFLTAKFLPTWRGVEVSVTIRRVCRHPELWEPRILGAAAPLLRVAPSLHLCRAQVEAQFAEQTTNWEPVAAEAIQ